MILSLIGGFLQDLSHCRAVARQSTDPRERSDAGREARRLSTGCMEIAISIHRSRTARRHARKSPDHREAIGAPVLAVAWFKGDDMAPRMVQYANR
jgi:hypothetical protein